MTRRRALALVAVAPLLLAPAPGDVGGCGDDAQPLDETSYVELRKELECRLCADCGLRTARCGRACDPDARSDYALPSTCAPLLRDGQVCVRALAASSCDDARAYLGDDAPRTPSECQFCRVGARVLDGGPP